MDRVSKTSYKCVSDSGSIIPFVPRADSVEQEHYHFEKATQEEVKEWKNNTEKQKYVITLVDMMKHAFICIKQYAIFVENQMYFKKI